MRKSLKQGIACVLAATMMMGATACGKGKEGTNSGNSGNSSKQSASSNKIEEAKADVKQCTFKQDEQVEFKNIDGQIESVYKVGDKFYLSAYKWEDTEPGEYEGADDADATSEEASEAVSEEASEAASEETSEASSEESSEAASEENSEAASEENSEASSEENSEVTSEDSSEYSDDEYSDDEYSDGKRIIYNIYAADADGNTTLIDIKLGDTENVREFVDLNGKLAVVTSDWTGEEKNILYVLGEDNSVEKTQDVTSMYHPDEDTWVQKLFYVNDSYVVIYDQKIGIYDADGNKKSEISCDDYIGGYVMSQDKNIYVMESTGNSMEAKKVDIAAGQLSESHKVNVSYFYSNDALATGTGDYSFYYKTSDGLYGYKLSDDSVVKLLDFVGSDISTDDVSNIIVQDEKTVYITESGRDGVTFTKYVKVDPANVKEKEILTCVSMYGNYDLRQAIINFNKEHDDVRINFVEYSNEEDPASKMSADIAAGVIPDIYDLSNGLGKMTVEQAAAKGMFEDLTPYLEKDPDANVNDLLPTIYDAMKINDKFYYIASGFTINSLLVRQDDVKGATGWTFHEFKEYVESKPADSKIFYSDNKSDILNGYMTSCSKDFVNWGEGKCYFDSDEFKDFLTLCNEKGTNEEHSWSEDYDVFADYKSGKILCLDFTGSLDDIKLYSQLMGDVTCIGYPSADRNGTYASLSNCLAMSSSCKNKEAAWDFIKNNISREFQGKNYSKDYALPTRKDIFEMYIKAKMATEETTDEFGNDIYPNEYSMGVEDIMVDIKPWTEEDANTLRGMVDRISGVYCSDESIQEIVAEEAKAFFSGDKSVDDVAAIIQNRVTTYINENK